MVDEGALRRRIGGAKVMHDQLVHLAEMAESPNIKVHVIPAEVGAHIGLLGAFAIAGFADDAPGILTFDTLRSEALPRGASRDLIMKVAEEHGRDLA
jgi:hypothetical protein